MNATEPRRLVAAAVLASGLVAGGWMFGRGVAGVRDADHYVTVKGVSEREVTADLAIWPLRLVLADDDLARAQRRMAQQVEQIRAFLAGNGIDSSGITLQDFAVTDAYANQFRQGEVAQRYVLRQSLIVRSTDPQVVARASQRVGDLVSAGIVLSSGQEYGGGGPTFLYTGLNELKPAMIAEATGRAREAAQQFARDAGSRLGGIRRANQGVFEILPRDQAMGISEESQIVKTVRVVSTVEYLLR